MKYICQTCEKPKVEAEIIRDNYNDEYICQTCYDEKKKEEQEEQEAFETESKLEPRKHELSGAIDSRKNFDFKWLFYILLVALLVSLAYLLLSGTLATILRGI